MGAETRREIAYYFFLVMGLGGVSFQMYEFITGHIDFELSEVGVTALFSVFIFKPTVLVDLFESIKNLRNND